MKRSVGRVILVASLALIGASLLSAGQAALSTSSGTSPTKIWPKGTPSEVGLDEEPLKNLDADFASGRYVQTDSFAVFRCGTEVYARHYKHDYAQIYAKESKTKGPLNARLTGPYNYSDVEWHPFHHGTDLHTMQSVSKTVTSIVFGVAITRGDCKASLQTPVLQYFDVAKVKNMDDRKRQITIENLLTMTSGMNSEELFYPDTSDAPDNDFVHMEASDDWVQYAIDKPVVEEPGHNFTYIRQTPSYSPTFFRKKLRSSASMWVRFGCSSSKPQNR